MHVFSTNLWVFYPCEMCYFLKSCRIENHHQAYYKIFHVPGWHNTG